MPLMTIGAETRLRCCTCGVNRSKVTGMFFESRKGPTWGRGQEQRSKARFLAVAAVPRSKSRDGKI